jgi:N-acetylmuramoyl-L-alanine amidase
MTGSRPVLCDHFPYLAKKVIMISPGHVGYIGIGAATLPGEHYPNPESCRTGTAIAHNHNEEELNSYLAADTIAVLEHTWARPYWCAGSFANKAIRAATIKPDAFVEIHCNAFHDRNAHGYELWHYGDLDSENLAGAIGKRMQAYTPLRNRGVKNMAVERLDEAWKLKHNALFRNVPHRPLVLLECGFLTNPVDAAYLTNFANHEKIVSAIVHGLNDHFKFERDEKEA